MSVLILVVVISVIGVIVMYINRHRLIKKFRANQKKSISEFCTGMGIVCGSGVGLVFGTVYDDAGNGLVVGMAIGLAIGAIIGAILQGKEH